MKPPCPKCDRITRPPHQSRKADSDTDHQPVTAHSVTPTCRSGTPAKKPTRTPVTHGYGKPAG